MIKIGIYQSGTGTTAIVAFKNNKLIDKSEYIHRYWITQSDIILDVLISDVIINIEDCLYTSDNASKNGDRFIKK
ncbi:hypothetical protein [Spiroplasma endosymbiont of Polydrusus formosus]|uniref:hypothetical protein n=1 Tax=Spiroplasma endosymbiont of Polydrusus formosus TaxID=3139326 RepID=UPI0035B55834